MKQSLITPSYFIKTFGSSMRPLLLDGDLVYFKKARFLDLQIDDIIVVRKHNLYVTHRIIYKSKKFVITKGDYNDQDDGRIYPANIIGRVYKIKRGRNEIPIDTLSLIHNSFYRQEIIRLSILFSKNQLEYIFLKGLPLWYHYTGHMPRRLYADCDLLVAEGQIYQAITLLVSLGYREIRSNNKIYRFLSKYFMETDLVLEKNGYYIVLDLHRRPYSFIRKLDFPDGLYPQELMDHYTQLLLSKKRLVVFEGKKIPIPDYDYLLLFLCVHFFTHTLKKIHRLTLIKEVIKKDKKTHKNWKTFLETVELYKSKHLVYPTLLLLEKLYPSTVPQSVLDLLRPKTNPFFPELFNFNPTLVFDESVDFKRVYNKFIITFIYSPQPFLKRLRVFISLKFILLLYISAYSSISKVLNKNISIGLSR